MGGILWNNKKMFGKKLRNLNSLIVPKINKAGLFCIGMVFLSHVRGLGCVENEELSTYGKSTKMHIMHKKWTDRVKLTEKN